MTKEEMKFELTMELIKQYSTIVNNFTSPSEYIVSCVNKFVDNIKQ